MAKKKNIFHTGKHLFYKKNKIYKYFKTFFFTFKKSPSFNKHQDAIL